MLPFILGCVAGAVAWNVIVWIWEFFYIRKSPTRSLQAGADIIMALLNSDEEVRDEIKRRLSIS